MNYNIKKIAQLCDERSQTWFDIYLVPGVEGGKVEVIVPREDRDPGVLRKRLLRGGACLPMLEQCRQELIAASETEARVIRRAARTGFRDDGQHFVGHGFVAGITDGSLVPPLISGASVVGNIGVRGTLAEWQKLVEVAKHSTIMIVALVAAFAALLLSLLQRPPFGLVFVGPSRRGKSTAQLVGASVLGFGEEEHLPTLNTTPAGLLETGLLFNDHMLPINEVATAKGKKTDIHAVLRDTTYALMSGKDVVRHSSWSQGEAGGGSFKTLLLMSSERSPDEWAERGGETREGGEKVRLIGVPVLFGGHETVFDRPPKLENETYEEWVAKAFERLRLGLPHQHGEAIRAYSTALVANPADAAAKATHDIALFSTELQRKATSPEKRDIIGKFGVLYAGGMAAIDANVLPIDEGSVFNAVRRACKAAIDNLPDPNAELKAGLKVLKARLMGGGMIDADEASTSQKQMMEQADGYFSREKKELGRTYTMRMDDFVRLFKTKRCAIRVAEFLDDEGHLRHQSERKAGDSLVWAQTHKFWPNDARHRSIVIYFPGSLDVLDIEG